MTHEHVVCVSSIDWDGKWQGHQEIASALAAADNEVLFIENTGVRAPALRDAPRLLKRARNWSRARAGLRTERDRLQVHSPVLLPFPYSPTAVRLNRRLLVRAVARWTARVGRPHPILLTFLPTPLVLALAHLIEPELTVYYSVDDLGSSSSGAARIGTSEAELLRTADLVFVTAASLQARALEHRHEVHMLPAGVSFGAFERARAEAVHPLPDLEGIPGPIVGFVGGLNQKLDEPLLADVARRLADLHFVVAGPHVSPAPALRACPNVHLLGLQPHAAIPRLLRRVAVGIIPYRVTEYTSHIYPAKLNEYLATGLPVVSTPLPEVVRFNHGHPGLVAIADRAETFAAAIRRAVQESSPIEARRRIAVARANRWEVKIAAMIDVIGRALAVRRAEAGRAGARTIDRRAGNLV
jgi:glycosyltransferase involved in cell wall biosynthesis